MKILYYFKEKDVMMDKWQRVHIFDELERHNCNITVFNPLEYTNIDEANEKLLENVKENKYDLFMTPHNHNDIYISSILDIKKNGVPTLLICFDSLITHYKHKNIGKYFDLVMLSQIDREGFFRKYKCNTIISPYAANPFAFTMKKSVEINKINFAGTPYGTRINKLNILLKNDIELDLYGNVKSQLNTNKVNRTALIKGALELSYHSVGRKVMMGALKQKFVKEKLLMLDNPNLTLNSSVNLQRINEIFSEYALSLSISEARNTGVLKDPINIVHLRNFEIPMSGGLQICSYFDELADHFEEDKEIIFYRNNEEFVEKSKFYLKPEQEKLRINMKIAARKRAENEHTWFCRFKKAFDILGLQNEYIE
ncbi:glycosyltransferase family 1 protein [Clostridium gasigenes]|uniref:glycosyltransferase family protein n=1 Tax=Clostridium gasigenes TaxID=94869 RepID=UPI00143838CE|nr:glycosyltransferase [Clostridium gasigenes]NKF08510.1 glycosyltransferase family 1 protein [Clostridium gasigenes]QSW21323.1 glycosyltransferase family 1 protein [Clostridium gasigenes]